MSKGLECLNKSLERGFIDNTEYEAITKELKALEIIKKKEVNVESFMLFSDYEEYKAMRKIVTISKEELTEEEWILVWSVLADD